MTKEEFFRILDACDVPRSYVSDYLKRNSCKSPFYLFFASHGGIICSDKIDYNQGELLGLEIDKTIFYVKPFSSEAKKISVSDVISFGKRQLHPNALPMRQQDLKLLLQNRKNYENLQCMLNVFGYSLPPIQKAYLLFEKDDSATWGTYYVAADISDSDGETDIAHFIKNYGNIFYCGDRH